MGVREKESVSEQCMPDHYEIMCTLYRYEVEDDGDDGDSIYLPFD